jgi:hypothetical protein
MLTLRVCSALSLFLVAQEWFVVLHYLDYYIILTDIIMELGVYGP